LFQLRIGAGDPGGAPFLGREPRVHILISKCCINGSWSGSVPI
jgi:hypothetical protein